jgi:hypothetical protein
MADTPEKVMTTQPQSPSEQVEQISRLIIENRNEDGNITPADQPSLRDDIASPHSPSSR